MKLDAQQAILRDGTREPAAMDRLGDDRLPVRGHGHVAVDEIRRRPVDDAREQRMFTDGFQAVPSDVGKARRVADSLHVARQQPEHLRAVLV